MRKAWTAAHPSCRTTPGGELIYSWPCRAQSSCAHLQKGNTGYSSVALWLTLNTNAKKKWQNLMYWKTDAIWQDSDPCATVTDMILQGFLTVQLLPAFQVSFHVSFHIIAILPNVLCHDAICCISYFQFANTHFFLNVGGLGLHLSFQEQGPDSQGTKNTWHGSYKWMQHWMNGCRETL